MTCLPVKIWHWVAVERPILLKINYFTKHITTRHILQWSSVKCQHLWFELGLGSAAFREFPALLCQRWTLPRPWGPPAVPREVPMPRAGAAPGCPSPWLGWWDRCCLRSPALPPLESSRGPKLQGPPSPHGALAITAYWLRYFIVLFSFVKNKKRLQLAK